MSGKQRKDKDRKRKSEEGSIPQEGATPSGPTAKEYEDVGISTPLVRYFNGESPKGKITQVECPVCNKLVSLKRINSHMDKNCDGGKPEEKPNPPQIQVNKSVMKNGSSSRDAIVLDEDDDDDDFRQTSSTKTKATTEPIVLRENELVSLPDSFKDMKSSLDDNLRGLLEFRMSLNPFKNKHLKTVKARQKYDHKTEDGACSSTKAKPRISLSNRIHATESSCSADVSERPANPSAFNSEYDYSTASETSFCSIDSSQTDEDSHFGKLNQSFSSQGSNSVSCMDVLSDPEDTQSRDNSHLDDIELENDGDGVKYEPYYWANFKFIMQHVLDDESNSNLFNEEDLHIVLKFRSLEAKAQQLYVRLFLRKYGWFKVEKLSYPKIGADLQPLIEELVEIGLLDDKTNLADLPETLKLLSASEVRSLAQSSQIFKNNEGKKLTSKVDLLAAILSHSEKQRCMLSFTTNTPTSKNPMRESILRRAKSVLGNCVRISNTPRELFGRFFSLFSLTNYSFIDDDNAKSTLIYRILQINKGELVFPSFKIFKSTPIFQRREDLIVYSNALSMEEDLMSFMEDKHFDKALEIYRKVRPEVDKTCSQLSTAERREIWSLSLPPYLRRFSAEWVHIRICGKSVEALEKKGMYEEAVALLQLLLGQTEYCLRARGPMWERLVIDTERYLKDPRMTLDYIKTAVDDPWVRAGMRLSLSYRAKRICNAGKNKHLKERLPEFEAEELDDWHEATISAPVFLDTSSSRRTIFQMNDAASPAKGANTQSYSIVEEYVLSYYKERGFANGVHGEGSPYTFIFTLLFWDIIFMEIPDVFIGPFQACPLDFNTDNFYENRKDTIDKKLQDLRIWKKAKLRLEIRASWLKNQRKVCVGANWNIFKNVEQVLDVVSCLGIKAVVGICELFSKDYRNRCSGMPDLLVWDAASRKCKAVEVKGPGDKLSHRQMIWLNVLTSLGVDAEVCYVKGVGGKRQRLSKN